MDLNFRTLARKRWGDNLNTDSIEIEMAQEINTPAALWTNLEALMLHYYGEVNLTRLAEECGFAQSTATRIKQQKHATGLDKIDLIARRFGVSAWQLLVPGFDPNNLPTLQPVSARERQLYEKIMSAAKTIIASEPDPAQYR